jgi:hypothetical protein
VGLLCTLIAYHGRHHPTSTAESGFGGAPARKR